MTLVLQDKKSVESTCLCFARLVDNFQHEEVRNDYLHTQTRQIWLSLNLSDQFKQICLFKWLISRGIYVNK